MANQCCCKGYNTLKNCVGCDTGSFTNYSVTATVSGFTDVYSCDVATHVNRTLVHVFYNGFNVSNLPEFCTDLLIAGNANPPESWCQDWCPPFSLKDIYYPAGNFSGTICPPDVDIGANEIPACVINVNHYDGDVSGWECRCRDLCSFIKQEQFEAIFRGYYGPYCYLTIWYFLVFRFNEKNPSDSAVEYYVNFPLANTTKSATSQTTPCDSGYGPYCPQYGGTFNTMPNTSIVSFTGRAIYDADQPCSSINIDIPLCPFNHFTNSEDCDFETPNIDNSDPRCFHPSYKALCGYPLDFSSANVNLTINLS